MENEFKKKHPILFEIVDLLTDPAVIVGGVGLALMAGGVTSIGFLAAGKITGNVAGLLAFGGGLASFALGGNILVSVGQIAEDVRKQKAEEERRERARAKERGRNITTTPSKTTTKTESKEGFLTRAFARPAKGKTAEERKSREKKATQLLKILRERDVSGQKVSVKNYKKQGEER